MRSLDEQERTLLERARSEFSPRPDQAARVRNAVLGSAVVYGLGRIAEGTTSSTPTTSAAVGASKFAGMAKVLSGLGAKGWLAGALVTVGVCSGVGLWAIPKNETAPHAPPSAPAVSEEPSTRTVAPTSQDDTAPQGPEPVGDGVFLEDPGHGVAMDDGEPATRPSSRAVSSERPLVQAESSAVGRAKTKAPSSPQASLAKELAGVRDAELALNRGDAAGALALLSELDSSSNNLREERSALRVLALCQLDRANRHEHAWRFVRAFPESLYTPRIRAACGE